MVKSKNSLILTSLEKIKSTNSLILISLVVFFTILNITDYIISVPHLEAESNPVVVASGTFLYLLIAKIIVNFGVIFFAYQIIKNNPYPFYFNYMFIFILVVFILLMVDIIISNLIIINNADLLEASKAVPTEIKIQSYNEIIYNKYIYPIIVALVSTFTYINIFRKKEHGVKEN